MISSETLISLAESLSTLHSPLLIDWKARFGMDETTAIHSARLETVPAQADEAGKTAESDTPQPLEQPVSRLFCTSCKRSVTPNVANYCWSNKARFQGRVYCFNCQKNIKKPASQMPSEAVSADAIKAAKHYWHFCRTKTARATTASVTCL